MRNRTLALLLFALMLAIALGDLAYHYPLLPERMATHFGPSGEPNGWMPKSGFAVFTVGLLAFLDAQLLGTAFFLRRIPDAQINLPNKGYWLAPARREATLATIGSYLVWFGVAIQTLVAGVFHLVYRANLTPDPRLGGTVWIYLAAFLVFTLVWLMDMMRRFAATPPRD